MLVFSTLTSLKGGDVLTFGVYSLHHLQDGGIVYYEFVDALLQKDEGIVRDAAYYDRR